MPLPTNYLINTVTRAINYSMEVIGVNLHYGYAGLLNLGIAAIGIIGAYSTAILVTKFHADLLTVLLATIAFSAVAAFAIGIASLRSRGDYFGIVTLGFGYVVYSLVLNYNAEPIRGALGISGIKKPELFGIAFKTPEMFGLLCLAILAVLFLIARKLVDSPYGRVLRAIRDDEDSAMALGKDTMKYRLSVFVIGSVFCAIGSSLYAYWTTYVEPGPFGVLESVYVMLAALIGGRGNLWGSVLGAFLVILLPEPLRFINLPANLIGGIRQLLFGLLLLLAVLYKPEGLIPERTREHK